jgi:hypothetical protein
MLRQAVGPIALASAPGLPTSDITETDTQTQYAA